MILAIDFDGTLVEHKFPEIGEPNEFMIDFCKHAKSLGHQLILWTCREDGEDGATYLTDAVEFCKEHGLEFDAVNENIDKSLTFGLRKVVADYYIDDRSAIFVSDSSSKEFSILISQFVNDENGKNHLPIAMFSSTETKG